MLKLFRPRKGRTNPGEGGRDPSEVAEVGIGREQIFTAEHLASSFGLPDHFKRDEVISPTAPKSCKVSRSWSADEAPLMARRRRLASRMVIAM